MMSACPALVPEPARAERPAPIQVAPVREQERNPRPRPWPFPFLAFVVVSLFVVLFLLQFARIVQLQYDLVAKKETMERLLHERAELQLSIEQLSALNRVETEARRLGMVHPENWQVLDLVRLARQGLEGRVASAQPLPPTH